MILRSPDFGNTITLDLPAINDRTQDGDLIQIYDETWGYEDGFGVTFSALSEEKKWELVAFYEDHIGQEIEFLDHEGRTWLGFITSKIKFTQTGPGCQYQGSFTFLGVLQ